jgi:hypothetical protein
MMHSGTPFPWKDGLRSYGLGGVPASKKPPGTWAVAKRLKKPRTWAVRRGQATSGNLRSSTWKPSLAIWAAKRLALISVER